MKHNQPGYKWYVVNTQTISLDSGWEYVSDANERAVALRDEGGVPKVMTKPRVGAQVLDPNDERSWRAKRNNPAERGRRHRPDLSLWEIDIVDPRGNVFETITRESENESQARESAWQYTCHWPSQGRPDVGAVRLLEVPKRNNPAPRDSRESRTVRIFVEGASSPVSESVFRDEDSAKVFAERKREEIRRRGSTHVVRVSPVVPQKFTRWCPRCGAAEHPMRTTAQREACARGAEALKKYGGGLGERENPRHVPAQLDWYVSTFCNFAHRLSDGKPIGHECYVLDPHKLKLEAYGRMDEIEGSIVKEPRVTSRGVRENPSSQPLDSHRAEKVFTEWHQKAPNAVGVIDTGCDGDDTMVCVGNANDIVYVSGKWEKGKKKNAYVHTFDSQPKVYMLAHNVEPLTNPGSGTKTVDSLLKHARNKDGHFAVAELARPESFSLCGADGEVDEIAIHAGAKLYGAVDKKTIIIADPKWGLIIVRGGEMHFDERGIVK